MLAYTHVQIRLKPATMTPLDSEATQQPVFGVHDNLTEKFKDEKERSQSLFLEQLAMVAEKQRAAREKALMTQQEEADMLNRTRQGSVRHTYL